MIKKFTELVGLGVGILVGAAVLVCLFATKAPAAEVLTPTLADYEAWLAKYADAKPDFKPGDVLTVKDLERVRPFIPPGYFPQLNFPELKMEVIAPVSHQPRRDRTAPQRAVASAPTRPSLPAYGQAKPGAGAGSDFDSN